MIKSDLTCFPDDLPDCSHQEIQNSDGSDPDQDIQSPVYHRAVQIEAHFCVGGGVTSVSLFCDVTAADAGSALECGRFSGAGLIARVIGERNSPQSQNQRQKS